MLPQATLQNSLEFCEINKNFVKFLGDLQKKKKKEMVFTPATHSFRVIFLVISKKKVFTQVVSLLSDIFTLYKKFTRLLKKFTRSLERTETH